MRDFLRLIGLFRPYAGWLALGVLLSFVTLLANVALMATSGWFITAMAIAGVAGVSMNYFTPAAIIRACAILRTTGRYAERLVTHEATLRLLARLRVWFYEHLEPLAPAGLQSYRGGDLLSRIRADIDNLDQLYLRLLVPSSVALLSLILFFLLLLRYDLRLALVELWFLLLAGVLVPALVVRITAPTERRMVETAADLRASVVDTVQGLGELLIFDTAATHDRRVEALGRQLSGDQARMAGYAGFSQAMVGLSANLALWLVLVWSILQVSSTGLPPAELVMLALFTLASFEAVVPIPPAIQSLPGTLAAARRIFAIADTRPLVVEPAAPSPSPADHGFELRGVWFRYRDTRPWVLRGVDLILAPGSRVALVGATGSGKSSLINLLLRFWPVTRGRICFGGHALTRYRGEELRRYLAVVPQHTHLFNTSIRQNLLLARQDADQAALEAACRVALIHDFIRRQPEGYDTPVGEAALKLSGGQARRIAIARALLKEAPVLILDEPAEDLDPALERDLMASLFDHLGDRSLLLVTHHLTHLQPMDEVLVLEQGRIVERGRHDRLLAEGTFYPQLYHLNRIIDDRD